MRYTRQQSTEQFTKKYRNEETTKKLADWWKKKQVPINRASIEQFSKEMKNGQIAELIGATHYVFVGPTKDKVITLMRDYLAK